MGSGCVSQTLFKESTGPAEAGRQSLLEKFQKESGKK